eukprot:comp22388_c0_seq1/m.33393 comp22388_c0_seq1/g.33393  ORF comp22388_c0_seq1/g.33393 comp22388_c0_seq1/m.33393 type:complete len:149 (-) comp22388_c0_seq1:755-1201(-)
MYIISTMSTPVSAAARIQASLGTGGAYRLGAVAMTAVGDHVLPMASRALHYDPPEKRTTANPNQNAAVRVLRSLNAQAVETTNVTPSEQTSQEILGVRMCEEKKSVVRAAAVDWAGMRRDRVRRIRMMEEATMRKGVFIPPAVATYPC